MIYFSYSLLFLSYKLFKGVLDEGYCLMSLNLRPSLFILDPCPEMGIRVILLVKPPQNLLMSILDRLVILL
jgi:hypothetical protein